MSARKVEMGINAVLGAAAITGAGLATWEHTSNLPQHYIQDAHRLELSCPADVFNAPGFESQYGSQVKMDAVEFLNRGGQVRSQELTDLVIDSVRRDLCIEYERKIWMNDGAWDSTSNHQLLRFFAGAGAVVSAVLLALSMRKHGWIEREMAINKASLQESQRRQSGRNTLRGS